MANDVRIRIIGEDLTKGAIASVEKGLGGLGDKLGGALSLGLKGVALGAGAAVTAVGAIGGAALGAGMQMDEAFDKIATGTGKTGEELTGLQESFKTAFASGPNSAEAVSDALVSLNQKLGLSGDELAEMSTQVANLARITGGDAATIADSFGRSIQDWGIKGEDASLALDKMYKAAADSGLSIQDLITRLDTAAPALQAMGLGFDESVALLGKWEKAGMNSEKMLMSLNTAAANLTEQNKKAGDSTKTLAQSFEDSVVSIQNAKTETEAIGLAIGVFGSKAGPEMAKAIREGALSVEDMVKSFETAKGAINDTAAATADFPEKFELIKNKATIALAPLGSIIMDGIGKALEWLGPQLDILMKWFTDNAPEIQRIAGEVFGAIQVVLDAVGKVLAEVVIPAVKEIAKWITENWPAIQTIAETVFNAIKVVLDAAGKVLSEVVIPAVKEISTWVANNWPAIKTTAETVFNGIKTVVETVAKFITEKVVPAFKEVASYVTENWPKLKETAETVFNGIKTTVEGVVNSIKTAVEGIADSIANFFTGIFEGVVGALKSSPLYELYMIATGQKALPKIELPADFGKASIREGSVLDQIFNPPTRATGGAVLAGTPYVVGERGPELFVPGKSGSIVPNGGGGTTTVNLSLDGTVVARLVMDRMSGLVYEDSRRYG